MKKGKRGGREWENGEERRHTEREGERGSDGVTVLITVRHIQPQNYIISLPPLTIFTNNKQPYLAAPVAVPVAGGAGGGVMVATPVPPLLLSSNNVLSIISST